MPPSSPSQPVQICLKPPGSIQRKMLVIPIHQLHTHRLIYRPIRHIKHVQRVIDLHRSRCPMQVLVRVPPKQIDENLRQFFLDGRTLLNCLFSAVRSVVLRMFHKDNKSGLFTPGFICVLHIFVRNLKWTPHIHWRNFLEIKKAVEPTSLSCFLKPNSIFFRNAD